MRTAKPQVQSPGGLIGAGLFMVGIGLYVRTGTLILLPEIFSIGFVVLGAVAALIGVGMLVTAARPAKRFTFRPDVPVYQLSPAQFEQEIARLITLTTPYRAEVVGGSGDRGVDVKVFDGRRMIGVVQCKRYAPDKALPPAYVRELDTVKRRNGVQVAYLATTARFSPATLELARQLGINLIDGAAIEAMRVQAAQAA